MAIAELSAGASWPDDVDEIFDGDQTVVLAQATPAAGVTLAPLSNFAVRDRKSATLSAFNTSIGLWKKLENLQKRPQVAIAYHTRQHGRSRRPEYVLVQGIASLPPFEDRSWIDRHRDSWERVAGPRDLGRLWEWWLRYYHWRVPIEVAVRRVVVWSDLGCRGTPAVYGETIPDPPEPQRPPRRGKGPRVNPARLAQAAVKLPYVLLGWIGGDGLPVVVPVEAWGLEKAGVVMKATAGLVPPGGRRAGLVAHTFTAHGYGQNQRKYTGWLEARASDGHFVYAPHTARGYYLPSFAFKPAAGLATRRGYHQARRGGLLSSSRLRTANAGGGGSEGLGGRDATDSLPRQL
jgi:hypothetical protein